MSTSVLVRETVTETRTYGVQSTTNYHGSNWGSGAMRGVSKAKMKDRTPAIQLLQRKSNLRTLE